ncbi:thrombopoietin receptor [Lampris incognitus]|uniref:thrombopoietin receptor n=1 Tax=Lampris incognitus TaxID=2546036 RepID=UPI0024B5481E|nr:thrombopoietin receptor [Lampris incognitus]
MDLPCTWMVLLLNLCAGVGGGAVTHHEGGPVPHLSREDILLLEDEEEPRCFTRTEYDFTCFFETPDNRTYDFFYTTDEEKRCNMTVQRTEEGAFLHVCVFPPSDTFLYVLTHLKVVEPLTSTTVYTRSVCVEDQVLLDPPLNVTLHHTGQPGQLRATCHVAEEWKSNLYYRIRYSSASLAEKEEQVEGNHRFISLVPGEVVQLQMSVKHGFTENAGHWSHWSNPAFAMVPQSADDISLQCFTADLQNITCQWNEGTYEDLTYKLFYKINFRYLYMRLSCDVSDSETSDWTECWTQENLTDLCCFDADGSKIIQVKLGTGPSPAPLSRTFYTEPFTVSNSIKTSPPRHLRAVLETGRLCLLWEAPLHILSAHLQYQISYQPTEDGPWMTLSLKGPETETCLEVPNQSHYSVQVRARPNGSIYAGHWSDWSHRLNGTIPSDIGFLLIACIPVIMLVMAVVIISLFSRYLSTLKQYLWPPVPNLDKVLQGFLTELNRETWDPSLTAKQCSEETPASLVEVISEEEVSELEKLSRDTGQLLSPARGSSGNEQVDGGLRLEVSPDYVTLSSYNVVPGQKGNKYIYEQFRECESLAVRGKVLPMAGRCSCIGRSSHFPSCISTDILNHSYLLLAKSVDRLDYRASTSSQLGNIYTNLECAAGTDR